MEFEIPKHRRLYSMLFGTIENDSNRRQKMSMIKKWREVKTNGRSEIHYFLHRQG